MSVKTEDIKWSKIHKQYMLLYNKWYNTKAKLKDIIMSSKV